MRRFVPARAGVGERVLRQTASATREFFGIANTDGHVPILLETLRVDSVPNFDLFTKVGTDYILYRAGEHPFTGVHRRALLDHRVRALYVPSAQISRYWRYVQQNISTILSDTHLTPRRKAEVFHASAIGLTQEVLSNPASQEILRTVGEVVKGSARLLLEGREGFHAFLNMVGKDSNLYSHAVNVCTYGIALARAAGTADDQLPELGAGLLLHDLGMVGVPDDIVNKPGALSEADWQIIRGHPERGLQIYELSGGRSETAKAVILCHHERMDGSGYPRGLRGSAIPLVGRVAATVNIFDALTTTRSFRPARSTFEAVICMKQQLRGGIDQELLNCFVRILGP